MSRFFLMATCYIGRLGGTCCVGLGIPIPDANCILIGRPDNINGVNQVIKDGPSRDRGAPITSSDEMAKYAWLELTAVSLPEGHKLRPVVYTSGEF